MALAHSSVQSDELTLPVGVSIIHANAEQSNLIRQNAQMCHELWESQHGYKVLFVMTDAPQTITVRAWEEFPVYYYGDQDRFFARLNPQNTPEISTDLNHWEQCSDENRIPVFRENPEILSDVNSQIEVLAELNASEQSLVTALSEEVIELQQLGESLNASHAELNQLDIQRDEVFSVLDQEISEQQVLEATMIPEEQLREDIHPVVSSSAMSDVDKNDETQEALDVYHQNITNPAELSPAESGVSSIPELANTQLTISYLTQELTRIQWSIDTVNAQITSKQNDINNTQNTIQSLQSSINQLTTQITQYANNYTYWRDEYNRIIALITSYNAEVSAQSTNYSNSRLVLMNAWRNDVPSDITVYNLTTLLTNLKNTILNEYNSVPYAQNTWPVWTEYNLPDETSSIRDYLSSQYYYVVDFPSSGKSWPATLRLYVKLLGATSFTQLNSYPVQNRTHAINMFNATAKPQAEKLAQYKYVDDVLERHYELYQSAKNSAEQQYGPRDTAKSNRDTAKSQLDIAYALNDQKQAEMSNLQSQQNLLVQQKTELENLKSIKSNLQNLYNQVEVILNNLKNHIVTHEQVSWEIQNLLTQYGILEEQIVDLIEVVESKIVVTNAQIKKVESMTMTLTGTTAQITTQTNDLASLFERNFVIKPRDWINSQALTYSQIAEYFSYAYRTSMWPVSDGMLRSRAIVEYLDNWTKEDLYPARLSYEYKINGKVYFTPQVVINNLEHKWVIAELSKIALSELSSCLWEIPKWSDLNDGIRKMWDMIRLKILSTTSSTDENARIREYENLKRKTIGDIILSGWSQAFFDHLLLHEQSFRQRVEQLISSIAQNQWVEEGTHEYEELQKTLVQIFAQDFWKSLTEIGFSGLTTYTNFRLFADSHIAMMANEFSANGNICDINDNWNIDEHGNKYKYWLYSLNGDNYPKYVWMSYSPDAISVQTVGPVVVNNLWELFQQKERWKKNLLQSKASHTNYNGWAYDIFQWWGDEGERIWWSVLQNKKWQMKTVSFNSSRTIVEKTAQEMIEMSDYGNFSSNEIFFRSLFDLQYSYFEQSAKASLRNLVQVSDQNLSLALWNILNYSINVTPWSTQQKELAKVIISFSWVSGYPANDVKNFQAKAIQQLDRLWVDYEQDIINDTIYGTINGLREGDMEELRTCVVLQKLSELFIAKWLEMQKIRETPTLDKFIGNAGKQSVMIWWMHAGIKRFYFGIEEGSGDSNLKKNMDFIKLSSLNRDWRPNLLWWKVYFLRQEIDLAHTGNILLWYNAKKLGLSLHETVLWSLAEQIWWDSLDALVESFSSWRKNIKSLEATISDLQLIPGLAIMTAYEDEFTDSISYQKWFNLQWISPKALLEIITN